ncbi:MAG: hypothetical protein ACRCTP_04735 [Aeromonas popoffii]|uniref:hypothetical protein n=1 Tax=Aeromonas popoffii TaxID=70856 RepID=UPI003F312E76
MLSKFKTRLVLAFLGLAATLKSKAETARGARSAALREEAQALVKSTTESLASIDKFKKAVVAHCDKAAVSKINKSEAKYHELEMADMELMAK